MGKRRHVIRDGVLTLVVLGVIGICAAWLSSSRAVLASAWDVGDLFVGTRGGASYRVYNSNGTFKEQISDGLDTRDVTGCAFDFSANPDLYTTNYWQDKVVRFDGDEPHGVVLPHINIPGDRPESIVFATNGEFYVSEARGNGDIRKYSAAGALLATYNVAVGPEGADWLDLAADQQTMLYTSEGREIRRYNVVTGANDVFTTLPEGSSARTIRILPPGSLSGGLIVATGANVKRVDALGQVVRTYDHGGENGWYTLALDHNGTSLWSGGYESGDLYRFNIASGALELGPININSGSAFGIAGLCVKGEHTAAQPTATNTSTPTRTATSTPTPSPTPTPEPEPPLYTKSYYIRANDPDKVRELGCNARLRSETGLAILHFGAPRILGFDRYGIKFFESDTVVELSDVKAMVIAFADGYALPYTCGSTVPVTPLGASSLTLVAGVSTSATFEDEIWHENSGLTTGHGSAWAAMIDEIYLHLKSENIYEVVIAGGIDSEYYQTANSDCRDPATGRRGCDFLVSLDADRWTTYESRKVAHLGVKFWVEGYNQAQVESNRLPLYNYGSCEDCPRSNTPGTWTSDELSVFSRVYHLTWELPTAFSFPQIYHEPYAYQWYNVRWYVKEIQHVNMTISGALTQCGSSGCLDQNPPSRLEPRFDIACHPQIPCTEDWAVYNCADDPCPNFPPNPGWQALSDMLSSPNSPEGTPNPSLPRQLTLPLGVSDIQRQP